MRFCPECANMLQMDGVDGAALRLRCRSCGHTASVHAHGDAVVWETRISGGVARGAAGGSGGGTDAEDEAWREPTLPVSDTIPCPAAACPTRAGAAAALPPRVVYRKVSARDMTYLYRCSHCRHVWASSGGTQK